MGCESTCDWVKGSLSLSPLTDPIIVTRRITMQDVVTSQVQIMAGDRKVKGEVKEFVNVYLI